MLDDFGVDDRFGSLNVGLSSFHLRLRRQDICRSRVYLCLAFITVTLDFGQGLCTLLTHTSLRFDHRRLQLGHFSCQAGQVGFGIIVDRLRLSRGLGHGGVSVNLNAVQCIGSTFQASLGIRFGAAGNLNRLLGVVTACLQRIVQRCGGIFKLVHACSVVLCAGVQVFIGLRELVLLDLSRIGHALGFIERRLQRRLGFITQGLHLGL